MIQILCKLVSDYAKGWIFLQKKWEIFRGSILDKNFYVTLERADIVYSWGVLYHTGAIWQALDNAIACLKPGGMLKISIYNNVEKRLGGSTF
jgi:2-polyprenyl-6-hydroxyphenyl methylase/3-demethylubiquinone-9 3-methyltransferase